MHHQKTLRAGAGHHAVEQVQWRSDGTSGQIRLHRQFAAHQRQWIALRPSPLRDAQLAEILACRARAAHRMVGEQRKTCVRTTGAVWPDEVAREAAELRDQIVETVGPLVSPAIQATTSASPHWTARAARRSAMTPQAPPVGKNSRKRGESPTYCTNGAGPSGDSVKLDRHSPSIRGFVRPLASISFRRALPSHQAAPLFERRA